MRERGLETGRQSARGRNSEEAGGQVLPFPVRKGKGAGFSNSKIRLDRDAIHLSLPLGFGKPS